MLSQTKHTEINIFKTRETNLKTRSYDRSIYKQIDVIDALLSLRFPQTTFIEKSTSKNHLNYLWNLIMYQIQHLQTACTQWREIKNQGHILPNSYFIVNRLCSRSIQLDEDSENYKIGRNNITCCLLAILSCVAILVKIAITLQKEDQTKVSLHESARGNTDKITRAIEVIEIESQTTNKCQLLLNKDNNVLSRAKIINVCITSSLPGQK